MRCDEVTSVLPGVVDGSVDVDPEVERHVASCLRCQADLVRYRKLLRALRSLRAYYAEPVPGLLAETFGLLDEAGERRVARALVRNRKIAYAAAIGGTAVATAATAVLIARRRGGVRLAS